MMVEEKKIKNELGRNLNYLNEIFRTKDSPSNKTKVIFHFILGN
jgi:hypothetical protein